MFPLTKGPSASPSSPGSPSRGASEFELPSLYQFSAVDAASAVDYSKDAEVNLGVVDSPPARVINRTCAASPSPLIKEKRALDRPQGTPAFKDDDARQGPSRRLRLDPLPCNVPVDHVQHPPYLPPSDVSACVDAPPVRIVVNSPTSSPSTVCRSESARCLTLRRSGRHSNVELVEPLDVALLKTMPVVPEPAPKVR